jgi:hypothetical protein
MPAVVVSSLILRFVHLEVFYCHIEYLHFVAELYALRRC